MYAREQHFFQLLGSKVGVYVHVKFFPGQNGVQLFFSVTRLRVDWIMDFLAVFVYFYFVKWLLHSFYSLFSPPCLKQGSVISLMKKQG